MEASSHDKLFTRRNWNDDGGAQIDFIGVPLQSRCLDVGLDKNVFFNTDHHYVWAVVSVSVNPPLKRSIRVPRCWKPAATWSTFASSLCWNWEDWNDFAETWRESALSHFERPIKHRDEVSHDL